MRPTKFLCRQLLITAGMAALGSACASEVVLDADLGSAAEAYLTEPGLLTREVWHDVPGTTIADIPFDRSPDEITTLSAFEAPTNIGDHYGQRLRGYLIPPTTGDYRFWIASDDHGELWLSTNHDPKRSERIAWHEDWTRPHQWGKHATQRSARIRLEAGRRYYIEARMKEHRGGDNLAVGWLRPGQSGDAPSEIIPGSALAPVPGVLYDCDPLEEDPAHEDPAAEEPAAEDPAAEDPAAEDPAAEDPAAEDPAAEDPAAEDPADDDPIEEVPADEGPCLQARLLWFEDFETGNYDRWSSDRYVSGSHQGTCYDSRFTTRRAVSGSRSHLASICDASPSNHRIYTGVQFDGDRPLSRYTNSGTGIDAPHGLVITFWSWLDTPGFGNGRWYSFFTAQNSCSWQDQVIGFGLENSSNRLTPGHVWSTGGTVTWSNDAPAYPFRQWVRVTTYLNYHTGEMHIWQNGRSVNHSTFRRNSRQICQFHWGLYANGANTDITLYEDDISIWKLEEAWTDFSVEPRPGDVQPVCD